MKNATNLASSRALWNRSHLDLRSREILAQIMDRGEPDAWRELYRIARNDAALRERILHVVEGVPLAYGHFWLAALAALGEQVDLGVRLPVDEELSPRDP